MAGNVTILRFMSIASDRNHSQTYPESQTKRLVANIPDNIATSVSRRIVNQGWRQENSDRGANASDEGANYFGTKALKPDRS